MEMKLNQLKAAAKDKKAIFLDLDNTLYKYNPCHLHALKETHYVYCRRVQKISLAEFLKKYQRARSETSRRLQGQAASHSRLHYFQQMLANEPSVSTALDFEEIYWCAFMKKMKREAWVLPFISFCKKTKKIVGVVTNLTTAIQMRKLRVLKLDQMINFLVTSEEAGCEKPNLRIFRLALQKAQVRPAEALLVGDDRRTDQGHGLFLSFFDINSE